MSLGSTFTYEMEILERHLDTFGHVNNATYLEILEEARWDLITRNGYGLKEVIRSKKGPTILEVTLRFKRELRLRERIRVETCCVSYEGKVGRLVQEIKNPADELCTSAEFIFGLFDTEARRLIEPTPEWRAAIGLH